VIVCGLDLSLTGAGVAIVQWVTATHGPSATHQSRMTLDRIGSKACDRSITERSLRLRRQANQIIEATCAWGTPDLVAVEDLPTGMTASGSVHDRAGLWWLVMARLDANGVPCVQVQPTQLKQHALGKGSGKGTDKDYVLSAVIRRYGHLIARDAISNDEADALILADMAAHHLGHPLVDLPATHLRALGTVPWPTT
jgi:crossover junction endodeoxyribonuclease RuvC